MWEDCNRSGQRKNKIDQAEAWVLKGEGFIIPI